MARANGWIRKHGVRSRRRWRKLHVGIDADKHEIVASELTPDDVGDVSQVPELLDQIDAPIASMTADGAFDSAAVYHAVAERGLSDPPSPDHGPDLLDTRLDVPLEIAHTAKSVT